MLHIVGVLCVLGSLHEEVVSWMHPAQKSRPYLAPPCSRGRREARNRCQPDCLSGYSLPITRLSTEWLSGFPSKPCYRRRYPHLAQLETEEHSWNFELLLRLV